MRYWLSFLYCLVALTAARAQTAVQGKVYDGDTQTPLEGVSVRNKKTGSGELTDRYGFFSVKSSPGDSIECYLLGYTRQSIVAKAAETTNRFVFLRVVKFDLPGLTVLARRDIKNDSLANRRDNEYIFNYRRPSVAGAVLGGLFHPLSGIEYLKNSAKRKRLRNFQEHLLEDEQERYVNSRYTRQMIADLTGLQGEELENFRKLYRPTYEQAQHLNEYDVLEFIKKSYKDYLQTNSVKPK